MTNELFAILGHLTVTATFALVIVLALRPLIRRRVGAQMAYLVWLLVPVAAVAGLLPAPTRPLTSALHIAPAAVSASATAVAAAAGHLSPPFDVKFWLLATWILGALLSVLVFLLQQRRYLRNLGKLSAIGTGELRAESNQGSPALVGALRPRIVLPQDFESRYTPHERELVLAHERMHRRRGDAQVNALVVMIRCLQWFNPLFHFAASRLRFDQELACDALVIAKFPHARRCYADALLKAQLGDDSQREMSLPVGCYWPAGHPLKERIAMLKLPVLSERRRVLASAMIAMLTLGVGYTSWAAQAPRSVAPGQAELVKIEGSFFAGDQKVFDHVVLIGSAGQRISVVSAVTPEFPWQLEFNVRPSGSSTTRLDIRVKRGDSTLDLSRVALPMNQEIEVAAAWTSSSMPAQFQANGPLVFKGTISRVDRAVMCDETIQKRRSGQLHAFDVGPPRVPVLAQQLETRGDTTHLIQIGTSPFELISPADGDTSDRARISTSDLPDGRLTLQIEIVRGEIPVRSETRIVALDEPVEIRISDRSDSIPVKFIPRPAIPEDFIPHVCRDLSTTGVASN